MKYLFQLGHQPHISIAELEAVFAQDHVNTSVLKYSSTYLIIESDQKIDSKKLLERLGGTIKISVQIKNTGGPIKSITHFLHKNLTGKIHFSVSGDNAKQTALAVKKELKSQGRSVRYIENKNTATIIYNNLVEKQSDFTAVGKDVFVTKAIQDIESFSKRDYDRPGSDDKSGMLPPKLARIMINLSQTDKNGVLLDPFCGSGTILTEALTLGFKNIIGTDISEKAIQDTKKNIAWLIKSYQLPITNYQLLKSDATQLLNHLQTDSVDTIISEPYMGKPLYGEETTEKLKKQAKELSELYIESFKSFYKILKKDGMVIFIIPRFRLNISPSNTGGQVGSNENNNKQWITLDCSEQIKKIGFEILPLSKEMTNANPSNGSLLYWRKKQYVGREIWKFKKT